VSKCKQRATFTKRGKRLSAPHVALWADVAFEDGRVLRIPAGQERYGTLRTASVPLDMSGLARMTPGGGNAAGGRTYGFYHASCDTVIRACTCSQQTGDNPNCRLHGRSRER
jgi:hypothetical protein